MAFQFFPPPALDPIEIAKIQMDALRSRWAGCNKCTLCEHRKRVIFGVGNPAAPIMVIGGAPNGWEETAGHPLAGDAGQLFLDALWRWGLNPKRDVWATNVVHCRAPKIDTEEGPRNRDPSEEELTACRPLLEAQIAIVKPAIIVCQGRVPNRALTLDPRPPVKYMGHFRSFGENRILATTHNPTGLEKRPDALAEYRDHWRGVASRLNFLGRQWRPDAQCFQDGWQFQPPAP